MKEFLVAFLVCSMPPTEDIIAAKRAEVQAKLAALKRNPYAGAGQSTATNGAPLRPSPARSPSSMASTVITPTSSTDVQRRLAEVRSRLANGRVSISSQVESPGPLRVQRELTCTCSRLQTTSRPICPICSVQREV